jgi:hypothetical protein
LILKVLQRSLAFNAYQPYSFMLFHAIMISKTLEAMEGCRSISFLRERGVPSTQRILNQVKFI